MFLFRQNIMRLRNAGMLLALLSTVSCAADYQTLFKKQGAGAGDKNDTDTVEQQGPTAGIEVIHQGQSVTKVPVGTNFMIQPTEDTKDLDNPDKPNCRNVGIVKVVYTVDGTAAGEKNRNGSCSDLMINYKIDEIGEYSIEMVVTSDDGETAKASMTLSVVDDSADPNTQVPGFRIEVAPNPADVNESITFRGICDSADVILIRWTLGDGQSREGASVTYAYNTKGSYLVKATCEIKDVDQPLEATVTVVVTGNSGDGNDGNGDGNDGNDGNGDGNDGNGDGNDGNGDGNDGNGDGNDGNGDGNDGNGDGNDGNGDGNDGKGDTTGDGQDDQNDGKGGDDIWDGEDDDGVDDPGQTDPGQSPSQI